MHRALWLPLGISVAAFVLFVVGFHPMVLIFFLAVFASGQAIWIRQLGAGSADVRVLALATFFYLAAIAMISGTTFFSFVFDLQERGAG